MPMLIYALVYAPDRDSALAEDIRFCMYGRLRITRRCYVLHLTAIGEVFIDSLWDSSIWLPSRAVFKKPSRETCPSCVSLGELTHHDTLPGP